MVADGCIVAKQVVFNANNSMRKQKFPKNKRSKNLKEEKKISENLIIKELEKKPEIKERPKAEVVEEKNLEEEVIEEETDFTGIESLQELKRILKSGKTGALENIPAGTPLEAGLIFAPRIKERGGKENTEIGYSGNKYETDLYNENKYSEKTPNYSPKQPESSNSSGRENQ